MESDVHLNNKILGSIFVRFNDSDVSARANGTNQQSSVSNQTRVIIMM